jgi:hypothetical protein
MVNGTHNHLQGKINPPKAIGLVFSCRLLIGNKLKTWNNSQITHSGNAKCTLPFKVVELLSTLEYSKGKGYH